MVKNVYPRRGGYSVGYTKSWQSILLFEVLTQRCGGKDGKIQLKGCSLWEHIFRFRKYEMHDRSACACINVGVSIDICRGSKERLNVVCVDTERYITYTEL